MCRGVRHYVQQKWADLGNNAAPSHTMIPASVINMGTCGNHSRWYLYRVLQHPSFVFVLIYVLLFTGHFCRIHRSNCDAVPSHLKSKYYRYSCHIMAAYHSFCFSDLWKIHKSVHIFDCENGISCWKFKLISWKEKPPRDKCPVRNFLEWHCSVQLVRLLYGLSVCVCVCVCDKEDGKWTNAECLSI